MPCRLLICDDNDDDVTILLHSLDKAGMDLEPYRTRDGQETIDFLLGSPLLNLIVLDHHLPRKTGIEVIEELIRLHNMPVCPVVVFSSRLTPELKKLCDAGALTSLEKPFSLDGYLEIAQTLVRLCD